MINEHRICEHCKKNKVCKLFYDMLNLLTDTQIILTERLPVFNALATVCTEYEAWKNFPKESKDEG